MTTDDKEKKLAKTHSSTIALVPPDEAWETVQALQKPGMVRNGDFLDQLSSDSPTGTWSLQWNAARTQSSLRSLRWPGYFFFHAVGIDGEFVFVRFILAPEFLQH